MERRVEEEEEKYTTLGGRECHGERGMATHTRLYILTHSIIGEISGHKNNALHLA